MIVLLTFMLAAFFMQFRIVKEFILDKIPMQKLLVFASVATIIGVGLLLVYFYSKLPWILALKQKISGLKEGVMSIVHMEKKMEYFLHTIFIWFSYLVMFYITLFVIPETSHFYWRNDDGLCRRQHCHRFHQQRVWFISFPDF
jgi:hypothetical protein